MGPLDKTPHQKDRVIRVEIFSSIHQPPQRGKDLEIELYENFLILILFYFIILERGERREKERERSIKV